MANIGNLQVELGIDTSKFTKKMKEVGSKMEGLGNKMKGVGSTMTASISAPLTALGAAAMGSAADVKGATKQIQNQLGLTGDEAERVGDVVKSVWRDGFGSSAKEVANNVALVKQNMRELDGSELEAATKQAMALEQSLGIDMADSTRAARALMENFGVTSSEAFDTITTGYQNGLNYSGDFLDTLNEYAPQFKALGMSSEDFINKLAAGAEEGAFSIDKVADGIKEFNIRAKDGSDTTKEAFQILGMNAEQMGQKIAGGGDKAKEAFNQTVQAISEIEDPIKRNEAAVGLFGTQFEDLESNVITALGNTRNELKVTEGAAQSVATNVEESLGTQFTSTMNEMKTALAPIGQILLDMVQSAMPYIQAFSQKLQGMSPIAQKLTVALGLIGAALGPLLMMFGSFMSAIAPLAPHLMKVLGPALTGVRTALMALTGPVGIAIAIIGLLATIIIQNWGTIRDTTIAIWNAVRDWVVKTAQNLKDGAIQRFQALKQSAINKFNSLRDGASNAFQALKTRVSNFASNILNTVRDKFTQLRNAAQEKMEAAKEKITSIWDSVMSFFEGIDLLQTGKDIIGGLIEGLGAKAGELWKKAKSIADGIKERIKGALKIASPSKVMRFEVGQEVGAGMIVGMDDMERKINRSAQSMAASAIPDVPSRQQAAGANQPIIIQSVLNGRVIAEETYSDITRLINNDMRIAVRKG